MYLVGCGLMGASTVFWIYLKTDKTSQQLSVVWRGLAIITIHCTILFSATYAILLTISFRWPFPNDIAWEQFYTFDIFLWGAAFVVLALGIILSLMSLANTEGGRKDSLLKIGNWNSFVLVGALVLALTTISFLIPRMCCAGRASAISALRTLSSAQELYKTRTGCYGESFDLNDGKDKKYIDPALARSDPDHPNPMPKSGYWIDISVNADNSDWCAIARPEVWEKGVEQVGDYWGRRNYIIKSDGVIYYNTEKDSSKLTHVLGSS